MTIHYSASYCPQENKLRLYATQKLPQEIYEQAKAIGFRYAPKQECFICPSWSPMAEDFLLSLCETIDDEEISAIDRAEVRSERYATYAEHRQTDAEAAQAKVHSIMEHIPLGQPILRNHHSERHARKDQERIHDGTRKAVANWHLAEHWARRAEAAIAHAKYKERPDVRARRIKGLEADLRKMQKRQQDAQRFLVVWQDVTSWAQAQSVANHDHLSFCFPLADYPRTPPASQYEGAMSLWSALKEGIVTMSQAQDLAIPVHDRMIDQCERWILHLEHRLLYERAMLAADGGTVADQTRPQVGGAVRCWVKGGKWIPILKVNKVTVTVADNWGNGGRDFTRTIPFDQLKGVLTPAAWQAMQTSPNDAATSEA